MVKGSVDQYNSYDEKRIWHGFLKPGLFDPLQDFITTKQTEQNRMRD